MKDYENKKNSDEILQALKNSKNGQITVYEISRKGVLVCTIHQRTNTSILVATPTRDEIVMMNRYGEYYCNHTLNIDDAIAHLKSLQPNW